jgi:UDP-N-acetylmuramoylalanine--D-glutamate ligase
MKKSFTIHKGKKSQVDDFIHARKRMLEELNQVQHRLEAVDEIGSVTYVNDSSATSVMSTVDSMRCIPDPVVWICCATPYDRDFILMSSIVRHKVKAIVMCGKEASDVRSVLEGAVEKFKITEDLKSAVTAASEIAVAGDVVLFSPSCAPGRFYKDVAERGEDFRTLVSELRNKDKE